MPKYYYLEKGTLLKEVNGECLFWMWGNPSNWNTCANRYLTDIRTKPINVSNLIEAFDWRQNKEAVKEILESI